ncbi:MAG: polyprenol phosphomannose-dependent alpha 1,6 mannosyltransferase MptB [Actinomycetota bacterium]|nr:polyprenol phosphomannose-dependent alpha 1,6 mannosyltransferase MptB [Actinomycetota bacterium]
MSTPELERPTAPGPAPEWTRIEEVLHDRAKSLVGRVPRRYLDLVPRSGVRAVRRTMSLVRSVRARVSVPEAEKVPYVPGVTRLASDLARPTLLGLVASVAIVVGASVPSSPFTLKNVPGAWYFGIPSPSVVPGNQAPGAGLFLGIVAVYAGMILMLRVWYDVVRYCSRTPGIPVARLVPVFAAWCAPLLFVAPLFSRDLYSYAAQGEMMSHHINPYTYGPAVLGQGPFVGLVDTMWQNVGSPYGPVFLSIAGWIVSVTGHNDLMAVEGLRLVALLGTVAFAWAVPVIARSFGRDGAVAFALAALNPLMLLHLVGGGHNDALMLGFLVPAYALARRGHPVAGIVVCAVGAAVKVPALIGVVYIGWEWGGPGRPVRARVRPVATALVMSAAVMGALSYVAGLGWGWIAGLSNPDTVRSWLDPATALGLGLGKLVALVGLGDHTHALLTLTRGGGLLIAAALSLVLLLDSERVGPLRALGWSLIAIVVLSPVVQPWYLAWGFVFLAPVVEGRVRRGVVVASGIACFVGLPGVHVLVRQLGEANPLVLGASVLVLAGFVAVVLLPRIRRVSRREPQPDAA